MAPPLQSAASAAPGVGPAQAGGTVQHRLSMSSNGFGWSSQGILNTIFYCMFAVLRSRQPPHGHGPGGGGGGGPRVAAGPGAQHDRAQDHPHLRPQGGELATTIHNSQRMRLLIPLLAL